jgi:hypothetical protein
MATRKPKKTSDHFIKALNPRDVDQKYLGDEPFFALQPDEDQRGTALARSFTWYGRFYGKKDAKELLAQYCEHHDRANDAKILRKVDEKEYIMTLCWLARMTMRGLELNEHEEATLENEIARLLKLVAKPQVLQKEEEEKPTSNRPNVQEIMKEKARDAAGELEGVFDEFYTTSKVSEKTVDIVAKFNVMSQHIPLIVEIWKKKQVEFEALAETDDKELKDAYGNLGKVQLRNILKFIEGVLGDLNSYISIKKASKAPRKKKAVPIEKIVSKLKYLKEFKDAVNKLDLVSVHPTKLHGASEAWVYDTAKRKLHHYIADEYSKSFTVKGNTILGFDTNASEIKTLRKPSEQIKEVMGSKPAARKFFKDIKAVATTPNGRFNENMIILKAF